MATALAELFPFCFICDAFVPYTEIRDAVIGISIHTGNKASGEFCGGTVTLKSLNNSLDEPPHIVHSPQQTRE